MGILDDARARRDAHPEPRRIDYDRMNRVMPSQKAALTRAVNAYRKAEATARAKYERNSPAMDAAREGIAKVCKAAIIEWNAIGAWPDNWHSWQIALDDALGFRDSIDLRDL
jgi:hypothetical protein